MTTAQTGTLSAEARRLKPLLAALGPACTWDQFRNVVAEEGLPVTEHTYRRLHRLLWPPVKVRKPRRPPQTSERVKLLLTVAGRLPQPFSLPELIVSVWRADPLLFSIPGFTQFPSDTKVRWLLFGRRGLIARGKLVKDGEMLRVA